VNSY